MWLGRAVAEKAGMIRINVWWANVAPRTRPGGFDPADPASPGYDWSSVDGPVRDVSAHGMAVLISIYVAPSWAEGAGRPADAPPGTWRPDPTQFALFAQAAARRYSGTYPDPANPGRPLPRVMYWQAWNEPNLAQYLTPQWTRAGDGYTAASPGVYRDLLDAFYGAVKSVSGSNFVAAAGTAPYGDVAAADPTAAARMRPLVFYRGLFCLTQALSPGPCEKPVYADTLDHHPYEIAGPPTRSAYWPDNVTVPDMWKIARVMRAAEGAGRLLPRGPKRLWVTELSWDSNPPSRTPGVPSLAAQARYVELAMYLLWRQGVDTVLLLQIRDRSAVAQYGVFLAWGGLYFFDGTPKPAAGTFRFPFVARRQNARRIEVWGRAPAGGWLTVSRRAAGRWSILTRIRVRAGGVFVRGLAVRGHAVLRARIGPQASLSWAV
jgi:hypothetical protein